MNIDGLYVEPTKRCFAINYYSTAPDYLVTGNLVLVHNVVLLRLKMLLEVGEEEVAVVELLGET